MCFSFVICLFINFYNYVHHLGGKHAQIMHAQFLDNIKYLLKYNKIIERKDED